MAPFYGHIIKTCSTYSSARSRGHIAQGTHFLWTPNMEYSGSKGVLIGLYQHVQTVFYSYSNSNIFDIDELKQVFCVVQANNSRNNIKFNLSWLR